LSPKENREIPPLDYARVHRLKADFPALTVILNGGLTSLDSSLAQLRQVDGIMLGRAAYHDPWLIAELDRRLFAASRHAPQSRADVVAAFIDYAATELERDTPLRAMTRHLAGLYAGRRGARQWRRELGELPDGVAGLTALARLAARDVSVPPPASAELPRVEHIRA
jgi:tRNA-dihydrouridine synthase A